MGDFNDEPWDSSLVRHALSTRQRQRAVNARRQPLLFNVTWQAADRPQGTLYFDNVAYLVDQFLVNRNMLIPTNPVLVEDGSFQIEDTYTGLVDLGSVYPKPVPFGGVGGRVNPNGFSDHFPVSIRVTEID